VPIVKLKCQLLSTGSHFYSVNIGELYWEYEAIASVYKGFNLDVIQNMSFRKRNFWFRMAVWRNK